MEFVEVDCPKWRTFHDEHFPGQIAPWVGESSGALPGSPAPVIPHGEVENDLGFYADGVKRTLTDEQIVMFRHSEIQRIMQQRRWDTENADGDPEVKTKRRKRARNSEREKTVQSNALPLETQENARADYGTSEDDISTALNTARQMPEPHVRQLVEYRDSENDSTYNCVMNDVPDQPNTSSFQWPELG